MRTLRPYQNEALAAIAERHATDTDAALVLPCRTGKTATFCSYAAQRLQVAPEGSKIVILVDRDELVRQTERTIRQWVPGATIGIIKADRVEVHATWIIASIQTLVKTASKLEILARQPIDLVIIDECHLALSKGYLRVLGTLGCERGGRTPYLGATATLRRGDGKSLAQLFGHVAFERTLPWAVRKGYMVEPVGYEVLGVDLDVAQIGLTGDDFDPEETAEALRGADAARLTLAKVLEICPDEPGFIYTGTIKQAEEWAQVWTDGGLCCEVLTGETPKDARRQMLVDFELGKLDWIANVRVLTIGMDMPRAAVAVMARLTQSQTEYIQSACRVLTPYPGKTVARIIDPVGVTKLHSLCSVACLVSEVKGGRKVKDGERLLEALDAWEEEEEETWEEVPEERPERVAVAREVSLFHKSGFVWQKTRAGFDFVDTGSRYLIILPGEVDGSHDVLWMPYREAGGDWIERDCGDWTTAQEIAEEAVTSVERETLKKNRVSYPATRVNRATLKIDVVALAHLTALGVKVPCEWTRLQPGVARVAAKNGHSAKYSPSHYARWPEGEPRPRGKALCGAVTGPDRSDEAAYPRMCSACEWELAQPHRDLWYDGKGR